MILKHKAELAGRVKLQISGGERGTIDYDWFDNMILDNGIQLWLTLGVANNNLAMRRFGVGSSSQAVSPTDVGLIDPLNKWLGFLSINVTRGYNNEGGFGWARAVGSYARGAASGNISELTISCTDGVENNTAISRVLIKDASGDPTTITVLSDEVLTITWEFRRWLSVLAPHSITYQIDGVDHVTNVTYTPVVNYGALRGGAGITGFQGSLVNSNTARRTISFSESQGNPTIGSIASPPHDSIDPLLPVVPVFSTFTPPIPKTNEFKCDIFIDLTLSRRGE